MKKIESVRASKLSRPMTCAGSLFFEGLEEPETNSAAKEGTACGELLAQLLTIPPDAPQKGVASNGVMFDSDMIFYAGEVAKTIKQNAGENTVTCEEFVGWTTRCGIAIPGTYDISYVKDNKLHIEDLKYGWNLVEVKENWQLIAYAIGKCIKMQTAFPKIVFKIHQPRPHHEDGPVREWEISYEQLLGYKEQIELRMEKISQGFAELVTSPKCKYCTAAPAACTAFNRAVFHGVDYVMSDFKQDHITETEIAYQMDLLDRVTEVLKIKSDSIKQLAVSTIKNGGIIPGYMTEQNFGDRKWKKEISPKVIETLTGIKIVEQKMMSPNQAEKLGVDKELIKNYVDRHFIGMKLVKKDVNKLADKIFGTKGN